MYFFLVYFLCEVCESRPLSACFISISLASRKAPGLYLVLSKSMWKMNNTGKVEALEPRWVCLRLGWTPHSLCVLPGNNLLKGPFPWLASILCGVIVWVPGTWFSFTIQQCSLPSLLQFFLIYVHTLSIALTGAVYGRKRHLPYSRCHSF